MSLKLLTAMGVAGMIGKYYEEDIYVQFFAPNCSTRYGTLKVEIFNDDQCTDINYERTEQNKAWLDQYYSLENQNYLDDSTIEALGFPTEDPYYQYDPNSCYEVETRYGSQTVCNEPNIPRYLTGSCYRNGAELEMCA